MARKYQLHGAFPSKAGDSAYQVAQKNGFEGTEQEWLASLVGPQGQHGTGESAYQVAQKNGFEGTEQEWLDSLVGPQGPQGPQGLEGGTGATFQFTITLEEDVSAVSFTLPVTWGRLLQLNVHYSGAAGLSKASGLELLTGGKVMSSGDFEQGMQGFNIYSQRYHVWSSGGSPYFTYGLSSTTGAADVAFPFMSDKPGFNAKADKNNFALTLLESGVVFPAGSVIDVWGVYV